MRAYIKAAGRKKVIGWIVKGLIFVLLFALLFFAAQRLLQAKWLNFGAGTSTWYEYKSLDENSVDVIFLGTSHVYSGVDPMYIYENSGITGYALGCAGLHYDLAALSLEEILRTQSPKVVFLDMSAIHYNSQQKESLIHIFADQISFSVPKLKYAFQNGSASPLDIMFPLFRYHSRWDEISQTDFRYVFGELDETYTRGHYISYNSKEDYFRFYDDKLAEKDYSPSEETIEILRGMKELCEENGAELVLMKIPTTKWYISRSEASQEAADEIGVSFLEMYYDFDEMGMDAETDFRDLKGHLNQQGAEKTSAYLMNYIEENYDLEDQRGSNQRWDDDLIQYKAIKEELKEEAGS